MELSEKIGKVVIEELAEKGGGPLRKRGFQIVSSVSFRKSMFSILFFVR